jgi:hypothetical protein
MSVEFVDLNTVKIALNEDGSFYSPKPTQKPKIHVSWIERPSGRIRYRSTGTDDRALAQTYLSAFIAANQYADAEGVEALIEEINELYLAEKRLTGQAQDYYLRPFVREFGKRLFSTLTKKDLIVYRQSRERAPGRQGQKVSDFDQPRTLPPSLTTSFCSLSFCAAVGWIGSSVIAETCFPSTIARIRPGRIITSGIGKVPNRQMDKGPG